MTSLTIMKDVQMNENAPFTLEDLNEICNVDKDHYDITTRIQIMSPPYTFKRSDFGSNKDEEEQNSLIIELWAVDTNTYQTATLDKTFYVNLFDQADTFRAGDQSTYMTVLNNYIQVEFYAKLKEEGILTEYYLQLLTAASQVNILRTPKMEVLFPLYTSQQGDKKYVFSMRSNNKSINRIYGIKQQTFCQLKQGVVSISNQQITGDFSESNIQYRLIEGINLSYARAAYVCWPFAYRKIYLQCNQTKQQICVVNGVRNSICYSTDFQYSPNQIITLDFQISGSYEQICSGIQIKFLDENLQLTDWGERITLQMVVNKSQWWVEQLQQKQQIQEATAAQKKQLEEDKKAQNEYLQYELEAFKQQYPQLRSDLRKKRKKLQSSLESIHIQIRKNFKDQFAQLETEHDKILKEYEKEQQREIDSIDMAQTNELKQAIADMKQDVEDSYQQVTNYIYADSKNPKELNTIVNDQGYEVYDPSQFKELLEHNQLGTISGIEFEQNPSKEAINAALQQKIKDETKYAEITDKNQAQIKQLLTKNYNYLQLIQNWDEQEKTLYKMMQQYNPVDVDDYIKITAHPDQYDPALQQSERLKYQQTIDRLAKYNDEDQMDQEGYQQPRNRVKDVIDVEQDLSEQQGARQKQADNYQQKQQQPDIIPNQNVLNFGSFMRSDYARNLQQTDPTKYKVLEDYLQRCEHVVNPSRYQQQLQQLQILMQKKKVDPNQIKNQSPQEIQKQMKYNAKLDNDIVQLLKETLNEEACIDIAQKATETIKNNGHLNYVNLNLQDPTQDWIILYASLAIKIQNNFNNNGTTSTQTIKEQVYEYNKAKYIFLKRRNSEVAMQYQKSTIERRQEKEYYEQDLDEMMQLFTQDYQQYSINEFDQQAQLTSKSKSQVFQEAMQQKADQTANEVQQKYMKELQGVYDKNNKLASIQAKKLEEQFKEKRQQLIDDFYERNKNRSQVQLTHIKKDIDKYDETIAQYSDELQQGENAIQQQNQELYAVLNNDLKIYDAERKIQGQSQQEAEQRYQQLKQLMLNYQQQNEEQQKIRQSLIVPEFLQKFQDGLKENDLTFNDLKNRLSVQEEFQQAQHQALSNTNEMYLQNDKFLKLIAYQHQGEEVLKNMSIHDQIWVIKQAKKFPLGRGRNDEPLVNWSEQMKAILYQDKKKDGNKAQNQDYGEVGEDQGEYGEE